ncbi:MAG TPA: VWA domain-containing protein, partial [Herpetosiphonaceae bacterium]
MLLDISASMAGAPLAAMGQTISLLLHELGAIPQTARDARMSVLTFASEASQISSLTTIERFTPPVLQAGGASALGKGLQLLAEVLGREVVTGYGERQRDHKPHIFLLTDGHPTDRWPCALRAFRCQWPAHSLTLIGLGCGPQAYLG